MRLNSGYKFRWAERLRHIIVRAQPKTSDLIYIIFLGRHHDDRYILLLAENPNHVYSKEELFREIWDMDSIGDIATVTVHIKKIREKIEFETAKPQYIETIWGVGYRFKV